MATLIWSICVSIHTPSLTPRHVGELRQRHLQIFEDFGGELVESGEIIYVLKAVVFEPEEIEVDARFSQNHFHHVETKRTQTTCT